ncbi:hypothetical protein H6G64_34120 [Calothrix sp. FACHB-156]|nr:hypothetical protein [Calothrix sp. FACHB-156]
MVNKSQRKRKRKRQLRRQFTNPNNAEIDLSERNLIKQLSPNHAEIDLSERNLMEKTTFILCVNPECCFHDKGFEYQSETGELTTCGNSEAYDLIIQCPNGHRNKVWVVINGKFKVDEVCDMNPSKNF